MSRDQKVMTLLPPMEWRSALSTSITELFLLLKFDNSSSARWLWANESTTAWSGVPNGTLSMFIWCPNLMFLASLWLEIYMDFQTIHFADFKQFKVDTYFANCGQVKIDPIWPFLLNLDNSQLFYWIWVRHASRIDSNPLCLKKFKNPAHKTLA